MIRIVLAEVPRLLADLLRSAIAAQSDMAVVKETGGDQDLDAVIAEADAHVLVTSLAGAQVSRAYQRLLFGSRSVALVTISADGHHAEVYDRKVIREVGVEQIVQVIRGIAQQRVPGISDN